MLTKLSKKLIKNTTSYLKTINDKEYAYLELLSKNITNKINFKKISQRLSLESKISFIFKKINGIENLKEYFINYFDKNAHSQKIVKQLVNHCMPFKYMKQTNINFDKCFVKEILICIEESNSVISLLIIDEDEKLTNVNRNLIKRASNMLKIFHDNHVIINGNKSIRNLKGGKYTVVIYLNDNPRTGFHEYDGGQLEKLRDHFCFGSSSGMTSARYEKNQTNISIVTRNQMSVSLLTHEMLHFFDIDENGMLRYLPNLLPSDHLNETLAQGMTTILNSVLSVYENFGTFITSKINALILHEIAWTLIQSHRILKIYNMDTILEMMTNNYDKKSMHFEYVIARIAFLFNIELFISHNSIRSMCKIFDCELNINEESVVSSRSINNVSDYEERITKYVMLLIKCDKIKKLIEHCKVIDEKLTDDKICGNMELEYSCVEYL